MKTTTIVVALAAGFVTFGPQAHAQNMNGAGLRRFDFPDGTGSIGLAAGWQTNAGTATRGVALVGPGDARVLIRNVFSVLMPNNPVPPTMAGRILVAPPSAPVDALAVLGPQLSRMSAAHGGPQMTFDNFVQRANAPASLPQGSAAIEDTQTGKRTGVNLDDSDALVDGLNKPDPNRYRQVRLRDQ